MKPVAMPSRVYHPLEDTAARAARLQAVADTLAAFHASTQERLARGESIDLDLVRASHGAACATLRMARQMAEPLEPELFAALVCLQQGEEAVRELLP